MDKTKPCLRCGSDQSSFERWVDDGIVRYRLLCRECLYAPDNWEEIPEKAVEYWNTRSEEDRLRAERDALKNDLKQLQKSVMDQYGRAQTAESANATLRLRVETLQAQLEQEKL